MAGKDNILLIIIREDRTDFGAGLLAVLVTLFFIGQLALLFGMIAVTPFVIIQTVVCVLIACLISNFSDKYAPIISGLVALVATLVFDAFIIFPIKENLREVQILIGFALLFSDIGTAILSYYVSRYIIKTREMKLLKQNQNIGVVNLENATLCISYKSRTSSIRMKLDIKPVTQDLLFVTGSSIAFNLEPGRYIVRGKVGGFLSLINERFEREITIEESGKTVHVEVSAMPSATKNISVEVY